MEVHKQLLFIGSSRYDFKTNDGEQLKGAKINVIDVGQVSQGPDKHGFLLSEMMLPFELFKKSEKLAPMKMYNFNLSIEIDGKKVKVSVIDFDDKPI